MDETDITEQREGALMPIYDRKENLKAQIYRHREV